MGRPKGSPKTGGRQKGTPNKSTQVKDLFKNLKVEELENAHEVAQSLVTDPAYIEKLRERLVSGRIAPFIESMLWYYAFGKPPETVMLKGDSENPLAVRLLDAHEKMSHVRLAS